MKSEQKSHELALAAAECFRQRRMRLIFAERYHGRSRNVAGQRLLGIMFQESGEYDWFRNGDFYHRLPQGHLRIGYSDLARCSSEPADDNYLWAFAFDMSKAGDDLSAFLNRPLPSVKLRDIVSALDLFSKITLFFHRRGRTDVRLRQLQLDSAVMQLFALSAQAFSNIDERHTDALVDEVEKFLALNLADGALTRESLAARFGISSGHLNKRFIAQRNCTVLERLHILRMERARFLLRNSVLRISEVAWNSGFGDPLYFSRCFAKYYGKSPAKYRKSLDKVQCLK